MNVYIPNLVGGVPFSVDKSFVDAICTKCNSSKVREIRDNWKGIPAGEERLRLARTLFIELLAYQFASPVQWIATQEYLFGLVLSCFIINLLIQLSSLTKFLFIQKRRCRALH
jgi:hypothetical protein